MNIAGASTKSPKMMESPRVHPRRVLSADSKSLPSHKKSAALKKQEHDSISPLVTQHSSSNGSASRWFDSVNQNVHQGQKDGTDSNEEPPFYIASQANVSNENPPQSHTDEAFGKLTKDDSENDDLRGVIDDLTVENKRLRQILKTHKRRTASPSTDSPDKLFEVKVHGLPPSKKRELEFLLKNFATNIHHTNRSHAAQGTAATKNELSSTTGTRPILKAPVTDSGYGSISNSGQASTSRSRGELNLPTTSRKHSERNVETYLRDIPDSLLPRQSLPLSERAKMALVVRRLEQLFTGKIAAPGEHPQPLQQQEVSHAAARADSLEDVRMSRKRKSEGTREAYILPYDSRINLDAIDPDATSPEEKQRGKNSSEGSDGATSNDAAPNSRLGSPDQRPTRPLDLDIERAQVATDNIDYIRHLGLSSPHPYRDPGQYDQPWLYLNLLINMAQLHTLNVTPEFIRRALKKLSTKFELTKDGHKVRWKGGAEGTTFTKEEEKAMQVTNNNQNNAQVDLEASEDAGTGSNKRSKTNSDSNIVTSHTPSTGDKTSNQASNLTQQASDMSQQRTSIGMTSGLPTSIPTLQTKSISAFDYKPIRYLKGSSRRHSSYLDDSSSSFDSNSGDSSGLAYALSQSILNKPKSEEGTLTFYSNPFYYSDFSGDKTAENMNSEIPVNMDKTLGVECEEQGESALRYHDACYFTPHFAPKPVFHDPAHQSIDLETSAFTYAGEYETLPIDLPVCGLGGVTPDDNFFIDVKVLRSKMKQYRMARRRKPLSGTRPAGYYQYRVAKKERMDLRPSPLPLPSYFVFSTGSSSGNTREGESFSDSDSSSSTEEDYHGAHALVQRLSTASSGNLRDNGDVDMDDNDSVDMLETARAINPARIAEEERRYLINQPSGGRAVAGSLAATVGASRSSEEGHGMGIRSDVEEVGSESDPDSSDEDEEMDDA